MTESSFTFDPRQVPFSRSGSYFTVNRAWDWTNPEHPGAFLVRCLADDPANFGEILRLEPLGEAISQAYATAGRLTLEIDGGRRIEMCMPALDILRIRGTGVVLRLHVMLGSYGYAVPHASGGWEAMPAVDQQRILIQPFSGEMKVDAAWRRHRHTTGCESVTIDLSGEFDVAIHHYNAIQRHDLTHPLFDDACRNVEAEFEEWANRISPLDPEFEPARRLAAYSLWTSMVGPRGLFKAPAVLCSKNWMTKVWSWDHTFHAAGLAPSHPELSWQQFTIFRDLQDPESGMLADNIGSARLSWLTTKNPVHGWALRHMIESSPGGITDDNLREIYGPLAKWTEFWLMERDFGGNGLPCILNPNESFDGTTHTAVDGPCQAPDTAAYIVLQTELLSQLATRLGYENDAPRWMERSRSLLNAMLTHLWDENSGRFTARRVGDGYTAPGDSIFNFVPLVLGRRLPTHVTNTMIDGIGRPGRFLTSYGLTSEALDSDLFDDSSYVRGPVWAPPNVFIEEGLRELGATELADQVRNGFCRSCLEGGMSENFNGLTGAPQADPSYNWTAAMFLWLARQRDNNSMRHA